MKIIIAVLCIIHCRVLSQPTYLMYTSAYIYTLFPPLSCLFHTSTPCCFPHASSLAETSPPIPPTQVHSGFLSGYDSVSDTVAFHVQEVLKYAATKCPANEDGPWKLWITGHSLVCEPAAVDGSAWLGDARVAEKLVNCGTHRCLTHCCLTHYCLTIVIPQSHNCHTQGGALATLAANELALRKYAMV